MKISLIYYSETGNTETAAGYVAEGIRSAADTELRLFNIADESSLDREFINESRAVVFGTPTYVANTCWQLMKFFDGNWDIRLGGKLGSVFATEASPNGGGAELAIMTLVNMMLVRGMLVYSSGNEYGKPTIHIGPTLVRDVLTEKKELCRIFGERIARKAHELFD